MLRTACAALAARGLSTSPSAFLCAPVSASRALAPLACTPALQCPSTLRPPRQQRRQPARAHSRSVRDLLANNREWAAGITESQPDFFSELAKGQTPEFLWIGCSDSRVPATQVVGLSPGEMFVHRNIANVVVSTDLNCQSVIQFAVEHLKVSHVIVSGHYSCGGVKAALTDTRLGLADQWTRHVRDLYRRHLPAITACGSEDAQLDLLCELNVLHQLRNVAETTIVRDSWSAGGGLQLHGLIYGLADGLLKHLVDVDCSSHPDALDAAAVDIIRQHHAKAGVEGA